MDVALSWVGEDAKRGLFSDPLALARHSFHASATAGKYPPTLGGHSLFFALIFLCFFLIWSNCRQYGPSAKIYAGWFVEGVEF
jgi:hypothetical protein